MMAGGVTQAADDWLNVATISMTDAVTPKLADRAICYSDGRDIACDTSSAYIQTGGLINAYALQVSGYVSAGTIHTSGTVMVSNTVYADRFVGDGSLLSGLASGDRIVSGSTSIVANAGMDSISFTTAGNLAMVISNTGHVGIGTDNPLDQLHVSGDRAVIRISHPTSPSYAGLNFYEGATLQANLTSVGSTFYQAHRRNDLTIAARNGGDIALQSEGDGSGRVGIGPGLNSPSATLHVSGTLIIADGGEPCDAEREGGLKYDLASNAIHSCDGIGPWAPLAASTAGSATQALHLSDSDGDTMITLENLGDTDTISFTTAGTERMMIAADGHVGIATSDPSRSLTISGTTWTRLIELAEVTGAAVPISVSTESGPEVDPKVGTLMPGQWCISDGSIVNCTEDAPSGSDNLGNHTASQTLAMGGHDIGNAGVITTDTVSATNLYGQSVSASSGYFPSATINSLSAGAIAGHSVSSTLVSASHISASYVQIASASVVLACGAGLTGAMRYTSGTMQVCNGTDWGNVGIGVPTGTIAAFSTSSCPSGWSEYTPARGRFLRGIDTLAADIDPDGTRLPGHIQPDAFQGHWHNFQWATAGVGPGGTSVVAAQNLVPSANHVRDAISDNINGTPRTANETRPKNVAVIFCQYAGYDSSMAVGVASLASLSDVSVGGATNGDALIYDNGTWVPGAGSGAADNMGDHTASQTLVMNGNDITGAGLITADTVSATNVYGLAISGSTGYFPAATISALSANAIGANVVSSTTLSATTIHAAAVSVTGIVSASYFEGDGSRLTGIGGTINALDDIGDVDVSVLPLNSALTWNGSAWVAGAAISGCTTNYDQSIVPVLTAASDGGYAVDESSIGNVANQRSGWNAFDASTAYFWQGNEGGVGWIRIQLPSPARIYGYSFDPTNASLSRAPRNWTFEGSNNGSDWDVLDTRSGITGWVASTAKSFPLSGTAAYSYYRINITANNGDVAYTRVDNMKLHPQTCSGADNLGDHTASQTLVMNGNDITGAGTVNGSSALFSGFSGFGGVADPQAAVDATGGSVSATNLILADGNAGSPAVYFNNDADTGLFRTGTNRLAIGTGGVLAAEFTNGGISASHISATTAHLAEICDETGANCKDVSEGWATGTAYSADVTGGASITGSFTHAGGGAGGNAALIDDTSTPAADPNAAGAWQYFTVDFGAGTSRHIRRMTIKTDVTYGYSYNITYNFQYSDNNADWTNVGAFIIGAGTGNLFTYDFPETGEHRYWRVIYAGGTSGTGNTWIQEVEMMELVSGPAGAAPWSISGTSIFYDGGNVGIGTTSPVATLDVSGSIRAPRRFSVDPTVSTGVNDDGTSDAPYSRVHADSFHTNGLGMGQMFIEGSAMDGNTTIYIGTGKAGGQSAQKVSINSLNLAELCDETGSNCTDVSEGFTGGGGGSIPAGAIMAFDLTSCPSGWSEYTPARGRFLRGIDNGAGNDPAGTRAPGHTQMDQFKSHTHTYGQTQAIGGAQSASRNFAGGNTFTTGATGGAETRPKNVAVLYCRKN